MDHFAKKNIFCVIISRLQRFFPQDYKFMPDSFLLPDEMRDFEQFLRRHPGQTFIAKPSQGRGGNGIQLIKKFNELPKASYHNEY
jgi:glutathione synthase/RimK-type ligase-like ATP-grasp enzyme